MSLGCIVLAGGKSSRLGQDKASVELEGRTLLQRSVANLEFLGSDIVIVAAPGQVLPRLESACRLITLRDIVPGQGPLIGLYTGLRHAENQYCFVVACDMPFVQRPLVEYMADAAAGYDVVMPRRARGLEPLHAIYGRSCIGSIESSIGAGVHKIDGFIEKVSVKYLEASEIENLDPQGLSFFNINTPADLAKAAGLLDRKTSDIQC